MTERDNVIGHILQVTGGILIAIYILRASFVGSEFGAGPAFDVFLQGVIFGMLLIGFGEVIKLMQGLFNQREPLRPMEDEENNKKAALQKSAGDTVSLESRNRIMDYYTKNNMIVDDIEAAPYGGYAIVHHDGKRDIVDMNNFELEILSDSQLNKNPELRALKE